MQEVHAARGAERASQANALAERAGGYRAFYWPGHEDRAGATEGNALLVREDVEVVSTAVRALSLDEHDPLDRVTRRIVARAALRHEGGVVDVIVTHLPISRRARARVVHEVLAFAADERRASGSQAAVLVGDLNAKPSEAPIVQISATWIDAWESTHPGARGATWPSLSPLTRIDYAFVQLGDGWSIGWCERAPFCGSDHRGVMVGLRS
jgi:endonuclease/exonuclease/phosphatase family metal-dependent hydrolase